MSKMSFSFSLNVMLSILKTLQKDQVQFKKGCNAIYALYVKDIEDIKRNKRNTLDCLYLSKMSEHNSILI